MKTFFLCAVTLLVTGCGLVGDDKSDNSGSTGLTVRFTNNEESRYPITALHLRAMGSATAPSPQGDWGEDILPDTLFPGESKKFTLPIPNGHVWHYRLAVIDSTGVERFIHEMPEWGAWHDTTVQGTITHWGSHYREVEFFWDGKGSWSQSDFAVETL